MRNFDWERIRQGKDAYRDRVAALPFDEKLRLLERLHERDLAFGGQRQALEGIQRETTSNISVSFTSPPLQQIANNAMSVKLGVFGATATLVAAIVPLQSSATTNTVTTTFTPAD